MRERQTGRSKGRGYEVKLVRSVKKRSRAEGWYVKGVGDEGIGRGLGKGGMANEGCHGGCEVEKGGRWRDDGRKGIKDGEEKEGEERRKGREEKKGEKGNEKCGQRGRGRRGHRGRDRRVNRIVKSSNELTAWLYWLNQPDCDMNRIHSGIMQASFRHHQYRHHHQYHSSTIQEPSLLPRDDLYSIRQV